MESHITSIFHGWNPWCPDSLDILSHHVLHPLNRKIILRHAVTLKAEVVDTLCICLCPSNQEKRKPFTFHRFVVRCFWHWTAVWGVTFLLLLELYHVVTLTWYVHILHIAIKERLHFLFTVTLLMLIFRYLLSTSLRLFAWPFVKLIFLKCRIGWDSVIVICKHFNLTFSSQ